MSKDKKEQGTPTKKQKKTLKSLLPVLSFILPYKKVVTGAILALLFTSTINLSLGQGIKLLIDAGFDADSAEALSQAMVVMITLIALLAIGTFIRFYLMTWIGERVSADIRKAVFNRLVILHPSYFEENMSGEIMSRLTTDTTLLQSIIGSSFSMALRSSLMLIGGLIMMFITNLKLTLIVIAVVPVVMFPMMYFGRKVRSLSKESQDSIADIGTSAGEVIQNIKVVQSYVLEEFEKSAFSQEVEIAFNVAKRRIKQRSILIATVIFMSFGSLSAMLWSGGMDVIDGTISAGELAAFIFYAMMVGTSVGTVAEVYGELQRAAGASERILELMSVEPLIVGPKKPQQIKRDSKTIIEFDKVTFHYPSRPDIAALNNISLKIDQGKSVALVGPSGAGKTTIFELLQRFYDPQQGQIRFKDIELKNMQPESLRCHMGMVPQQPVLFSSDVWHNIRYGNINASDEDVIQAAKAAHAHEFIEKLPQGYSSFLGEKGVRLSGGQKQRIALARAILKDPELLLLDEATSALDAESEHHVQAAVNHLMKDRTTIIIAHRLATVIHADLIVLMDQGKILDIGKHNELLKRSSLYQRLCELQFEQPST